MNNTPFFILGCVRSGTTLLRDILRLHPRLESPEETHFFRWSFPLGTKLYEASYSGKKLFIEHREMDGVEHFDFYVALSITEDRKALMDWYGNEILKKSDNLEGRWFDKTPQNVYGLLLINEYYPESKFIHIHRHPLNVVASLMKGEVMPENEMRGAINYWMESMIIFNQFKQLAPDRLLEVEYESLVKNPRDHTRKILAFLGEDDSVFDYKKIKTHAEKNKYKKVLTSAQVDEVMARTEKYRAIYGYE